MWNINYCNLDLSHSLNKVTWGCLNQDQCYVVHILNLTHSVGVGKCIWIKKGKKGERKISWRGIHTGELPPSSEPHSTWSWQVQLDSAVQYLLTGQHVHYYSNCLTREMPPHNPVPCCNLCLFYSPPQVHFVDVFLDDLSPCCLWSARSSFSVGWFPVVQFVGDTCSPCIFVINDQTTEGRIS